MSIEYMHIGIPTVRKKENMFHSDFGFYLTDPSNDDDYKIEYLNFDENTVFPDELTKNFHVAYKVDKIENYINDGERILFGPEMCGPKDRLAFIVKDGVVIELYEDNTNK